MAPTRRSTRLAATSKDAEHNSVACTSDAPLTVANGGGNRRGRAKHHAVAEGAATGMLAHKPDASAPRKRGATKPRRPAVQPTQAAAGPADAAGVVPDTQQAQMPAPKRARRSSTAKPTLAPPHNPTAPTDTSLSPQNHPHMPAQPVAEDTTSGTETVSQRPVLLKLGHLVTGRLVARPSRACRTPYVADVHLAGGTAAEAAEAAVGAKGNGGAQHPGGGPGCDGGGKMIMAHAPSLDCAGMVAVGVRVHMCANAPRAPDAPQTRTSHAIQVVEDVRGDGGSVALVGYHPTMAENLAREALSRGLLAPLLGAHTALRTQVTVVVAGAAASQPLSSRVDFALDHPDGSVTLLEVKNVVCADFEEGRVPQGRSKVGVYTAPAGTPSHPYQPTALFPHGSVKPGVKVVSDRAIKHIHELTQVAAAAAVAATGAAAAACTIQGVAAAPGRVRAALLFLVNRSDCAAFRPCHEADPLFAAVLKRAHAQGVQVLAHDVAIDLATPEGAVVRWGKRLPLVFAPQVADHVDEEHLAQVLEFNKSDPRKQRGPLAAGCGARTTK